MAIKNSLEDDQLEQQGQAAGGLNTSGVSGTAAYGGTAGAGKDAGAAPTSSGFVNLDKYLDANQGSGAKMASEATADLSKQADDYGNTAKTTAQNAATDYTNAARTSDAQGINQSLAKDASGTKDQANAFLGANYGGQAGFKQVGDYTAGLKATQGSLDDNLKQVDDVGYQVGVNGQPGLLGKTYGKDGANYGSGFGALDSFLINGSADGRQAIANVKGKTANVDQAYGDADSAINKSFNAGQDQFNANKAGVKNTAHDLFTQKDQSFGQQVAKKNAGLDFANRDGVKSYGAGDFASDKDLLDLQALASLSGQDNYDASKYAARGGNEGVNKPAPVVQAPQNTVSDIGNIGDSLNTLGQLGGGNFGGALANQASNLNPVNSAKNAVSDIQSAVKNGGIPTQVGGTKIKKPKW